MFLTLSSAFIVHSLGQFFSWLDSAFSIPQQIEDSTRNLQSLIEALPLPVLLVISAGLALSLIIIVLRVCNIFPEHIAAQAEAREMREAIEMIRDEVLQSKRAIDTGLVQLDAVEYDFWNTTGNQMRQAAFFMLYAKDLEELATAAEQAPPINETDPPGDWSRWEESASRFRSLYSELRPYFRSATGEAASNFGRSIAVGSGPIDLLEALRRA